MRCEARPTPSTGSLAKALNLATQRSHTMQPSVSQFHIFLSSRAALNRPQPQLPNSNATNSTTIKCPLDLFASCTEQHPHNMPATIHATVSPDANNNETTTTQSPTQLVTNHQTLSSTNQPRPNNNTHQATFDTPRQQLVAVSAPQDKRNQFREVGASLRQISQDFERQMSLKRRRKCHQKVHPLRLLIAHLYLLIV